MTPNALTEVLVQFARGLAFRVAVFEIRGEIPLMQVSDQLTWIAEAVVSEVLRYAYREVANQARSSGPSMETIVRVTIGVIGSWVRQIRWLGDELWLRP